jgi:Xaa-Pro dipeptidase
VVSGGAVPEPDLDLPQPDLDRMAASRRRRLVDLFRAEDAALLVLSGQANVAYATGARVFQADAAYTSLERAAAVLAAGDEMPHLFTPWPDGVPAGYPGDLVHRPDELATLLRGWLEGAGRERVLLDEELPGLEAPQGADSAVLMDRARRAKDADEIACIAKAQSLNEAAMAAIWPDVVPGASRRELSGRLVQRAIEDGAEATVVEAIWQAMPAGVADGPRTLRGGPAFPLAGGEDEFRRGDLVWVDSGFSFGGYHSDFGRTWTVGVAPTGVQLSQFRRWCEVIAAVQEVLKPGATGADLTAAARRAAGGNRPWLPHLYLSHGVGLASAETPLIGTDLGEDFDRSLVLEPGNTLVLEPVIWDDGAGGYRSEEVYAIAARGFVRLSDHTYEPYT